jgi:CDP-glucose 4,6-dehydratase
VVKRRPVAHVGVIDAGFWRGRRVLVTGHTGFKGAWLSLWLQSLGARVWGFAARAPSPSLYELARVGEGMERVIAGDVRDPHAVAAAVSDAAPEVVFHLAAQPLVRRSYAEPRLTYEVNVLGTVNVLDAMRLHGQGVRVLVNVTSDKCYENRASERDHAERDHAERSRAEPGRAEQDHAERDHAERGLSEDDQLGGEDPYSSSKACAELVTTAYRRSFFGDPAGPRLASARAGNVIGGGDWGAERLVPDVFRAALAGEQVRVRNPASIRPWQHVLNPLSGYLLLARALWSSPAHAAAWNFGPPERDARPVRFVVERLSALWPEELRWRAEEGPHPPEARSLRLDSARARSELGWRPPVALEDALAATVAWYEKLRAGADMRAVTLSQIEELAGG